MELLFDDLDLLAVKRSLRQRYETIKPLLWVFPLPRL